VSSDPTKGVDQKGNKAQTVSSVKESAVLVDQSTMIEAVHLCNNGVTHKSKHSFGGVRSTHHFSSTTIVPTKFLDDRTLLIDFTKDG
jgi:hypothetical protein